MVSSGMLSRVAVLRTNVSEGLGISSQRASVASYSLRCSYFTDSCHPDEGGAKFLRNVVSYKSHTA
jgi:hypothetical protein